MASDFLTETFEANRALLTGVAYRMLGRFTDAEDVVQDTWLRWSAEDRADVREPRAYLVRVATRLALDRLRQLAARRETYVGPWLPEPVATGAAAADPAGTAPAADVADRAVLADTVSFAVLVVLESLSPAERAVFVLREAFAFPYEEIAAALERSEPAVRQLASRARKHVAERRPRYDTDPVEARAVTERFLTAASGGDLDGLLSLLAPDARLVSDSGGKSKAPLRVIEGGDKVGRFLAAVGTEQLPDMEVRIVETNGAPALLVLSAGTPDLVLQLSLVDGRIACVYLFRNPDKLGGMADSAAHRL
ncbi:RNA polymerase sigma factor SigJ [Streptomyces sp. NPDC020412]|uniref:RNA polymerase sigma factor SigJ n=1 Tax=Streptomyces sp. NPDC020412 TaxID=3365073 RepID=UPI0037BA514A